MINMKYWMCILLAFCSCQHKSQNVELLDLNIPAPPPPPNTLPPSAPPNFKPNILELAEIQINPIPHPFNLDGSRPYAVWVNGERLPLNSIEVRALAQSLNLKFEQPKNTAKIHNGEGWQYPLNLKTKEEPRPLQSFFEEEVFIDVE